MDFENSKTKANLAYAFAGESQAAMKYGYYASQAKKDGYVQISNIFAETAVNETAHAKLWFKLLHGGEVPSTPVNLLDAATGEHEEWTEMYRGFADEAREEGFGEIADLFEGVLVIEKGHEARYRTLIERLESGEVFRRGDVYAWKCNNCGHIHIGISAPDCCPVCDHPQAHFEIRAENY